MNNIKNCTLIGKNAGFWLKDGDEGYTVIGSFSDEETEKGMYDNCALFGVDEKLIIKRDILEFLGIDTNKLIPEDSIN